MCNWRIFFFSVLSWIINTRGLLPAYVQTLRWLNKGYQAMLWGAFHSTKNSVNSGLGSEWNRHFPEFHSEILEVPREVGLKFRKIGITGKFCSIRPFLLVPRFSETGNRNSTWLVLKLLNIRLVLCQINDWNMLLQRYCSGLAFLPSEIESLVFVRFD